MTDSYLTTANNLIENASKHIRPSIAYFNTVGIPDRSYEMLKDNIIIYVNMHIYICKYMYANKEGIRTDVFINVNIHTCKFFQSRYVNK